MFVTAGCDSPGRDQKHRESAAAVMPEGLVRGQIAFFDAKLLAAATVSRGMGPGFGGHGEGGGGGRRYGGHRGGGRHMHGGGSGASGMKGADDGEAESSGASRGMNPMSRSLPPVALRLQLKNQSNEALDVRILDVKSELGDFVAQPERLLLAPGQASEIDPMFSQLGVPTDGFEISLQLQAGGKTETRPLVLHTVTKARDEAAKPRP
jgi:hypothetical protein